MMNDIIIDLTGFNERLREFGLIADGIELTTRKDADVLGEEHNRFELRVKGIFRE